MIDYRKWNDYRIGKIPWINSRRGHLSRKEFINYVNESKPQNILEIGAGELIEAQKLRIDSPEINYTIMDVSDTFLGYAKTLGFKCYKGDMINPLFNDKEFDLVYLSAVLEHSPDIEKTIHELKRISKSFYFVLFKWRANSGNLKSKYHKSRKFFSTEFSIKAVLELIEKHGIIKNKFICTLDSEKIKFENYIKSKTPSRHRNGNWLCIEGIWNER